MRVIVENVEKKPIAIHEFKPVDAIEHPHITKGRWMVEKMVLSSSGFLNLCEDLLHFIKWEAFSVIFNLQSP
ncbi:hypothetical protein D3C76_1637500 [compost metagenome]